MDLTEIAERIRTEFPIEPTPERIDSLIALIKQAEVRQRIRDGF